MNANLHAEIEGVIKRILVCELGITAAVLQTISSTTPLLGRGVGLDSSETVALVLGIENEFGISVPDEDLTTDLFKTIGTLTQYVLSKLAQTETDEDASAGNSRRD